jgi:hypothetical protein
MKVFISYRREDSNNIADRMNDWLKNELGPDSVFKDVDSIPLGRDFRGILEGAVARCDVLLAVIGPRWLDQPDAQGRRRVDNPSDWVRIEVETALERDIPVIPLLVDRASFPRGEALPPSLRRLVYRNGMPVRPDPDFRPDMQRLIKALREIEPGVSRTASTQPASDGERKPRSWWNTLPGILTTAGVIMTCLCGLIAALNQAGVFQHAGVFPLASQPAPTREAPQSTQPAPEAPSTGTLKRSQRVRMKTAGAPPATEPNAPLALPAAASDKVIEVWFAGSPHRRELPSAAVSSGIRNTARELGYGIRSQGLHATDFLPKLLKAVEAGNPPDIIFVNNSMHVSGGKTELGSFNGMQSDARLLSRLVKVDEALGDLGRGWTFLVDASPDHAGAHALVLELSGCPTPLPAPPNVSLRPLQMQAEAAARGFLQCKQDFALYDRAALTRNCVKQPIDIRRVSVCVITAAAKLALVETTATIDTNREVGRRSVVSVHRFDDGWRLLMVSGDPVSTGVTAVRWRELASRFGPSGAAPAPASLLTSDGVLPRAPAGQRFGDFTWLPAKRGAIGQFVEVCYPNDTRLFLLDPTEGRLSTGNLMSAGVKLRWRVWTVGADGTVAFSETRSFQH